MLLDKKGTQENGQGSLDGSENEEESDCEIETGSNLMNPLVAMIVLEGALQFLKTVDTMRVCEVSRLWHDIGSRSIFWRTITVKDCRIADVERMVEVMRRHGTRALDLRDAVLPRHPLHFWMELFLHLRTLTTLEELELGRCPPMVTELVRLGHLGETLRGLSMEVVCGYGNRLDLSPLERMGLERLDLAPCKHIDMINYSCTRAMKRLKEFRLSTRSHTKWLLTQNSWVPLMIVPPGIVSRMASLRKLALHDTGTLYIPDPFLFAIGRLLENLRELELLNCTLGPNFISELSKFTKLKGLVIAPTNWAPQTSGHMVVNIHQLVINAAYSLRDNLEYFKLGVYYRNLKHTKHLFESAAVNAEGKPVKYPYADDKGVLFLGNCKCRVKPCFYDKHLKVVFMRGLRHFIAYLLRKCQTEVMEILEWPTQSCS